MKKGALITLEGLVKALPTIILGLLLISIIGTFIYNYMNPSLTDPQKDFKFLVTDLNSVMGAPPSAAKFEIKSPMRAKEWFAINLYSIGTQELPPECRKQSCVCLVEYKGTEPTRTCVAYSDVKACSATSTTCGKELCFLPAAIQIYKDKPIAIPVSKECNTVRLG